MVSSQSAQRCLARLGASTCALQPAWISPPVQRQAMPARMFSTPSRRVTSPLKKDYQARLSKGTVRPDQRQAALVDALGSMLKQLSASVKKIGGKTKTQGAYVFGPVCVHHLNLVPSTWVVQFCSVVPGCSCFPSSALVFPCCHRLSGSPPPAHILKIIFLRRNIYASALAIAAGD